MRCLRHFKREFRGVLLRWNMRMDVIEEISWDVMSAGERASGKGFISNSLLNAVHYLLDFLKHIGVLRNFSERTNDAD